MTASEERKQPNASPSMWHVFCVECAGGESAGMTKNSIRGPVAPKPQRTERGSDDAPDAPATPSSTKQSKSKDKLKDKNKPKISPRQRSHRAHGAHKAHAAHGAGHHDEEGGGQGVAGIEGKEGADVEHRRHEPEIEHVEEEVEEHELHDTGATGSDAIKRSHGESGGDGFEGGQDQREAYERYLRGNVHADQERIDGLKKRGARDDFNPDRTPQEVEALGTHRATAHMIRLYETWTLAGVTREEAIQKAATFVAQFAQPTTIRKVLAELERNPIRDVYPLEVLMRMLEERPDLLPGVRPGSVIGNTDALVDGSKVFAGYATTIEVPGDVRLKSFALLGGGRPGYEFHPHKDEGKFQLLVDTPGRYTFAVLAAPLQQLGRMQRETSEAILEIFSVNVHAMGKKGEPISAEEWEELQDGVGDDADGDEAPSAMEIAPNLAMQARAQIAQITRDEGTTANATTYSWDATFYKPGAPLSGEPILHVVVERASAFDAAWVRAREAIAAKQKEYEPARAPVTQEDFTTALRIARVR